MVQVLLVSSILLWIAVAFNLLLMLALLRRVSRTSRREVAPLRAGEPAPPFTAQTLSGQSVTLGDYAGRDVAFIFVAPDCQPCRESLPNYQAWRQVAQRSGNDLILVSVADAQKTKAFVDEFRVGVPVLIAPKDSNRFMHDYRISGTPGFCLIDRRGFVQSAGYPQLRSPEWKSLVEGWEQVSLQAVQVPSGGR